MSTAEPPAEPPDDVGRQYPAPPPSTTQLGRGWTVASFVCAVIALVFLPIVIGPLGAVLGYVGYRKGDPLGRWAMIASIAALVLGMVLGFIVFNAND